MANILPKVSIIQYCQKKDSFLSFLKRKCSKSAQNVIFHGFWPILGPYDPLKIPLHYQQSMINGSYTLKSLHKLVLPETVLISQFYEVESYKLYPKFVFLVIFDHFHFHNPLKSPLYQQQSTCKGSYSPKSLHKLVIPETVFISYFYEVEMYLMYPEVVYLVFLVILSPPPPNPFKVPLYYQ